MFVCLELVVAAVFVCLLVYVSICGFVSCLPVANLVLGMSIIVLLLLVFF